MGFYDYKVDCSILSQVLKSNTQSCCQQSIMLYGVCMYVCIQVWCIVGAKSSPTCANYALQQVARDNAHEFPQITKLIRRNFYMDDFVKSVSNAD